MGKQKAVIRVILKDEKAHTKAFKIAVGQAGVVAASIQREKGEIEVVGEFDPVVLATMLRKKFGHADLVTVAPVVEKVKEEKDTNKKAQTPQPQTVTITCPPTFCPPHCHCRFCTQWPVNEDGGCTVM